MELRQIQYFIQLYEDMNITKASKNLYISQQGLSKSVSRLEEELGFPLFDRHTTGVVPTDAANMLYTYFNKIAASHHELLLAIDNIRQNRVLNITAYHGFAMSGDKDLFAGYKGMYPQAQIHYKERANGDILSQLLYKKADIAFMLSPIPKELASLKVMRREPVYLVMDKKHPLARKKAACVDDLYDQQILLLDIMEEYNTRILQKANAANVLYQVVETVDLNEFCSILHSAPYVGFSSRLFYQYYDFPEITFIPFPAKEYPDLVMETHLVALPDIKPDEPAQQYIDYILEETAAEDAP